MLRFSGRRFTKVYRILRAVLLFKSGKQPDQALERCSSSSGPLSAQPEIPPVKLSRNEKGDKKGNPGIVPRPMDIIQDICVLLHYRFQNCHCGAVIKVMQKLGEFLFPFRIVQVKNHTNGRIKIVFKIKAAFCRIGKGTHRVLYQSQLYYNQS